MRSNIFLVRLSPMAARARVPVRWLQAEADAGRVPCLKAGKQYLFDPDLILRLLVERARGKRDPEGNVGARLEQPRRKQARDAVSKIGGDRRQSETNDGRIDRRAP